MFAGVEVRGPAAVAISTGQVGCFLQIETGVCRKDKMGNVVLDEVRPVVGHG